MVKLRDIYFFIFFFFSQSNSMDNAIIVFDEHKNSQFKREIQKKFDYAISGVIRRCNFSQNCVDWNVCVEYLKQGVDPNRLYDGFNYYREPWAYTPLTFACAIANEDMVKSILSSTQSVDVNLADMQYSPLLTVCMNLQHNWMRGKKNERIVKMLLSLGADPNGGQNGKRHFISPLSFAVNSGFCHIASLLLKYGADPNIQDSHGNTALFYLQYPFCGGIVSKLIEHGINVNHRNRSGQTFLNKICRGRVSLVYTEQICKVFKLLLDAGLDINSQDKDGNTGLHYIVQSYTSLPYSSDLVFFFLHYYANPSIVNKNRLSVYDLACQKSGSTYSTINAAGFPQYRGVRNILSLYDIMIKQKNAESI